MKQTTKEKIASRLGEIQGHAQSLIKYEFERDYQIRMMSEILISVQDIFNLVVDSKTETEQP